MTLDAILDSCVEELRQTGNLEACVQQHPEQGADLRPLLQTALVVMRAPAPNLPSARKAGDLKELTALVEQRRTTDNRRLAFPRLWRGRWGVGPILQGARLAATLAVVAVLFWGIATAVGESRPGTFFYPLRRTVEQVRLAASRQPEAHAQARLLLARRRLDEFKSLSRESSLDLAANVMLDVQDNTHAALREIAETSPQEAVPLLSQAVALLQDEVVAFGRAGDRAAGTSFAPIFAQARTGAQSQLDRAEQAWQQPDAVKALLLDEPSPTPAPLPEPTATPQAGTEPAIPPGPPAGSMLTPRPTVAPVPTLALPPIPTMPPLLAPEAPQPASPVPAGGSQDRSGLSDNGGQQSEPQPDNGDQKDKSGEDGNQHDDGKPKDEDPQHD